MVDARDLALAVKRIAAIVDRRCGPDDLMQHHFDRAPFGDAYVSIAPSNTSEFASGNHNRLYLCGARGGLTADGLKQLLRLFEEAGVARHFVWLSPGPDIEDARAWIEAEGLKRVPYVAYFTLAGPADESGFVAQGMTVREVRSDEARALSAASDQITFSDFARCAGTPEFHHFAAFDSDVPIATAALCMAGNIGYLCKAFTGETYRRRGAQQALISARVARARALGSDTVVSETLSILESSVANLRRAGFETVYEKEVYSSQ